MTAVEKINNEMQQNASDTYTEILGQYIIDRCGEDPAVDAAVAEDGKTLKGAMAAVYSVAQSKKHGSVSVLTPAQVFGAVDKYFGLKEDVRAQLRAMNMSGDDAPHQAPAASGNVIDLADFL